MEAAARSIARQAIHSSILLKYLRRWSTARESCCCWAHTSRASATRPSFDSDIARTERATKSWVFLRDFFAHSTAFSKFCRRYSANAFVEQKSPENRWPLSPAAL